MKMSQVKDKQDHPAAEAPQQHFPNGVLIVEDDDDIIQDFCYEPDNHRNVYNDYTTTYRNLEIIEEVEEGMLTSSSSHNNIIHHRGDIQTTSLFSIDINNNLRSSDASNNNNVVYVAVGKSESSSDALLWALDNVVIPRTTLVYLVHIFSEIKYIPSPLGGGWVHKSQVSRELVEIYVTRESNKRRELLSKYIDKCTSHMVQVETILIESESVAKAIVELISVLNIPKLILGISKSNLKKVRAGKWNGSIVSNEVVQSALGDGCEVNVICEGKDIMSSSSHLGQVQPDKSPIAVAAQGNGDEQHQHQRPPNLLLLFRLLSSTVMIGKLSIWRKFSSY